MVISRDVIFEEEEKWDWGREENASEDILDWGEENSEVEITTEEGNIVEQENEVPVETVAENTENPGNSVPLETQQKRDRRPPTWMQDYEIGKVPSTKKLRLS